MSRTKDERATSHCDACGEEFPAREVTGYFHKQEDAETTAIHLCEDCAENAEDELGTQFESDQVTVWEEWARLQQWVKEQQEQQEQNPQPPSFYPFTQEQAEALKNLVAAARDMEARWSEGNLSEAMNKLMNTTEEAEDAITHQARATHVARAEAFCEQVSNARLSDEEIAKLPKDPEATYEGAVDNDKRASFALQALLAYNIATGSDLETAIKDLIGDLGHFLDRHNIGDSCDPEARPTMAELIADAAGMYSEETDRKGEQFNAK